MYLLWIIIVKSNYRDRFLIVYWHYQIQTKSGEFKNSLSTNQDKVTPSNWYLRFVLFVCIILVPYTYTEVRGETQYSPGGTMMEYWYRISQLHCIEKNNFSKLFKHSTKFNCFSMLKYDFTCYYPALLFLLDNNKSYMGYVSLQTIVILLFYRTCSRDGE